jgi:hypothetical protein
MDVGLCFLNKCRNFHLALLRDYLFIYKLPFQTLLHLTLLIVIVVHLAQHINFRLAHGSKQRIKFVVQSLVVQDDSHLFLALRKQLAFSELLLQAVDHLSVHLLVLLGLGHHSRAVVCNVLRAGLLQVWIESKVLVLQDQPVDDDHVALFVKHILVLVQLQALQHVRIVDALTVLLQHALACSHESEVSRRISQFRLLHREHGVLAVCAEFILIARQALENLQRDSEIDVHERLLISGGNCLATYLTKVAINFAAKRLDVFLASALEFRIKVDVLALLQKL